MYISLDDLWLLYKSVWWWLRSKKKSTFNQWCRQGYERGSCDALMTINKSDHHPCLSSIYGMRENSSMNCSLLSSPIHILRIEGTLKYFCAKPLDTYWHLGYDSSAQMLLPHCTATNSLVKLSTLPYDHAIIALVNDIIIITSKLSQRFNTYYSVRGRARWSEVELCWECVSACYVCMRIYKTDRLCVLCL